MTNAEIAEKYQSMSVELAQIIAKMAEMHRSCQYMTEQTQDAGFVPGVKFIFDGKMPITFIGYTEFLRMEFLDEKKDRHMYVDIKPTAERIEMFKKVED